MRPRIRTLKPEIWADEEFGHLDPWARLLFIGLITMADDEGRLRAPAAAVLGHVFPYDDIAPKRLSGWLQAIEEANLIVQYEDGRTQYVAITGWNAHQRINRPTPSKLPAPSMNGNAQAHV